MDHVVSASVSVGVFGHSRTLMRYYFSGRFLEASKLQAQAALERESADDFAIGDAVHWLSVVGAISHAMSAVEAGVNEVWTDVADGITLGPTRSIPAPVRPALAWHWVSGRIQRAPLFDKLDAMLVGIGSSPLERGREPWQALGTLVTLRNALVHYRPENLAIAGDDEKTLFERRLQALRLKGNPLFGGQGNPYFPDHALSADLARWSHATAEQALTEFASLGGVQLPAVG